MKKRLLVIGAGGHGRAVAEVVLALDEYHLMGFMDDAAERILDIWSLPVIGPIAALKEYVTQADAAIVAIGNNRFRQELHQRVLAAGLELVSIIHPRAVVSPRAQIGPGSAVMANAIIGTEAILGEGVIVNCGAVVDHHCKVASFGHLGVNACMAGGSTLGDRAWMQAGSSLGYGVHIASDEQVAPGYGVNASG